MVMERESVIKQGEAELTRRDVCPICRGLGSYACVHCLRREGDESWYEDECPSCDGRGGEPNQHTCALCSGTGHRTAPEVLYAEEEGMRDISLDGYRLQLWDTGTYVRNGPQIKLHYRLTSPTGEVLFEGTDYGASPMDAIDSDNTVRGIIGFLTLRPGDTDADYFHDYTEAQWAFAHGPAEELSIWALEPEAGDIDDPDLSVFRNWGDEEVQQPDLREG